MMTEIKNTELNSPKLDIIVLGARTEEKDALDDEIGGVADQVETAALRERVKDILCYSVPSKSPHPSGNLSFINVGVVDCAEMGNVASSINTAYFMARYRPSLMIFSGIAGSMNSTWFRIGDVIIPKKVRTRYFQKLKTFVEEYETLPDNEKIELLSHIKGRLHPNTETVEVSQRAKRLLSHLNVKTMTPELETLQLPPEWLTAHPGLLTRRVEASAHEEIFCWDKVLSNTAYVTYLRKELGNAASAVDMESYGFLRTINKLNEVDPRSVTDGIVVRAISDYAEYKDLSDDNDLRWRNLAKRNMAIATRYIIQNLFDRVY